MFKYNKILILFKDNRMIVLFKIYKAIIVKNKVNQKKYKIIKMTFNLNKQK